MNKKYFGKRIKLARKDRGFTGEKLSELCHVNPVYIRQIEAGQKVPSMSVFIKICQELKVSPNYLLADTLSYSEIEGIDILADLWHTATPSQLKLITAMIQSALEALEDDG